MLTITIPAREAFNEQTSEFVRIKEQTISMEHSLVSISKWESKWHQAFFGKREKTPEMMMDYIKCMTLTQNVDDNIYMFLTEKNIEDIKQYMEDPQTASYFRQNDQDKPSTETVTSELIYYWMIELGIPPEYRKWHINRLMSLIRVCSVKTNAASGGGKGMPKKNLYGSNNALNKSRKNRMHSKG